MFAGQQEKDESPGQSKDAQFQNRRAPSTGSRAPAGIKRSKKKTKARSNSQSPESASRSLGKQPRHQRRRRRMKKTSAEPGQHQTGNRRRVARRERQSDISQRIDKKAGAQKFFAAHPIRQNAHRIGRDEIRNPHDRDQKSGLPVAGQVKITADQQIKGKQRDLIEVRKRAQRRA